MFISLRNSLFTIMIVPFHVRTDSSLPGGGRSLGSLLDLPPVTPKEESPTYCWVDGVLAAHVVPTDLGRGSCALLPVGRHDSPDSLRGHDPSETEGALSTASTGWRDSGSTCWCGWMASFFQGCL